LAKSCGLGLRFAVPWHRARSEFLTFLVLLLVSSRAAAVELEDCPAIDPVEIAQGEQAPAPPAKPSIIHVVGNALWNEAKRYGSDTAALVVAPFHWDARDGWHAVGAAGMIGGAFWSDKAVYNVFAKYRSNFTNGVSSGTTWYGGGGGFAVAAGLLGVGLVAGDADVRDMGRDALETAVIAGVFTNLVIKPVAGRYRPSQSDGETIFDPFSGHTSFTSGHATQAFAVSSVIAMRAPGWIIPTVAYGLAFVVACDRINDRAHFFSDVVTGALFATATGRFLVRRHREEASGVETAAPKTTLEVVPIPDGAALRLSW
jgi:membrane-associated phospholipid phosphatase